RGGRVFRNREDFRYLTWRDALLPPPAADGARLRPPPPPRHDISATFDRRLTPVRSPSCSRSPCPRSPSTSTSAWPTWRRRRDLAVAAPASACQGAGGRSGVKWDMRAALLCLGLLGCTHPCPEYRLPPGPTHTFLWEATGPATLYLYGTYHVASRDEVPDAAWSRLAASKAIILELPERRPSTGGVEALSRLPGGKPLDQLLPADAWYDLRDAVAGQVSEDNLRRMRPWVAMGALRRAKYPQRQVSMDEAILAEAKRHGLAVLALEEWEEQLSLIDVSLDVDELLTR